MKKILLILLALSMFMVSCGGPSKEEPIDEASEENEDKEEKIDEDAEIDYAVSVDGEDYGYVETIGGRLFNASGINKIMVRAWKSGEYADDKALDQVTDYSKLLNDNEIIYGVYPGSMEFSYTYNESYNISYKFVGDIDGIDSFAYKKHAPEEALVLDETLYFDIDYLSSIFAFKYKIDKENKVLVIDSKGEYTAKMTELDPSGYDSLEALLKANFDK